MKMKPEYLFSCYQRKADGKWEHVVELLSEADGKALANARGEAQAELIKAHIGQREATLCQIEVKRG